ncbi:MAG TPA: DegQ family serine endoprotease [Gammaproteobacteria bacterium]|nr:DegQ family serine endoprotease [Gammaproteobacteria bacterium]
MLAKTSQRTAVFVLFFSLLWSLGAVAAIPWQGDGKPSLAPMLKTVLPGVVNISTVSRVRLRQNPLFSDPFFRRFFNIPEMPRERERQSLGSGVIVDADKGYVLTNNHVIEHADEITVTLRDGRHFSAEVVGTDPEADLAVLRIEARRLTAVPFGDSDELQVGDFVVAIGNPFGLGQTVTSGIVSALGRSGLGIEGYEDFIQTDASINPGNSGGALVDLTGHLIGINTAIVGPAGGNVGIGFAIPSNMAREIMAQLIEYGEVRRGQLGVMVQDVTPELADALGLKEARGAVISQVLEDSPAERAGLKVGDVVVSVNGETVKNAAQLRNRIGLLRVGSRVTLDIIRDGRHRTVKAVIEEPRRERADAGRISKLLAGAELGPITPNHPLAGRVEGIEVLDVERGSIAWQAGLRRGDIIVTVNRMPVKTLKDLRRAVKSGHDGLLLNIRRGEGALFIVIR